MANKPRIRFKGFTEDWEQRKLSDILKVNSGKDYKHLDQGNIPVYGTGGYMLSVNESLSNIDAIGIGRKGTIDKPQYLKAPFWTVDTLFYLTALDKHSILFLYYLMQLIPWKKFDESTGVPSLSKTTIDNISGFVPSNFQEEELISALFNQLDKSITLHQCKLEKLKLTKKALLQKLFPKNGKHIPEIRFKGFTDAWEQRKLNDFGIATGGTSIESEFVDGGTYKVISIGSYSEESVYNDQGLRVNKTDKTKFRILNKDDLTMILNDKTASGNIIGRVLLIDQDNTYVYNQRTERIEVDTKNFLPMFLYHMLNAPEQRKYIVKASQGNTQIYVNWSTINNIDYMIPQLLLEQEKIANLFSLNNKDITLHQRKLERLQEVKKGLLQKMFV
ncbi:MAG: restriction endonuclease subunit S [Veillonella sp.]|uniref:restriction endonuclease subunit S n=1 Tax=Veillonella sp. TaxID=1926307 RepID=UPI00290C8CF2|nr:restriction endonuclease subunit S [Veillonella sp.]MDU5646162.1 restriction endonuclease subunit S [Veillonella sp.]